MLYMRGVVASWVLWCVLVNPVSEPVIMEVLPEMVSGIGREPLGSHVASQARFHTCLTVRFGLNGYLLLRGVACHLRVSLEGCW